MSTNIYVLNTSNQALVLGNSVSPYLAPSYWSSLATSLPGFMIKELEVMTFNRNEGIADGSTWVFTTKFTLGGTVVLLQEQVTGTATSSKLKQSITAGSTSSGWQDFSGAGPAFVFTASNGTTYSISWDLELNGAYDDIHYGISIAP
jgi:hypothetical protein